MAPGGSFGGTRGAWTAPGGLIWSKLLSIGPTGLRPTAPKGPVWHNPFSFVAPCGVPEIFCLNMGTWSVHNLSEISLVNPHLTARLNGISTNLLVIHPALLVLNRVAFLIIKFVKSFSYFSKLTFSKTVLHFFSLSVEHTFSLQCWI